MEKFFIYDFIIGKLAIAEKDNFITQITTPQNIKMSDNILEETLLIKKTKLQLDEYFNGTRNFFDINFKLNGTDFQKKVWAELIKIPYGSTISYKELATRVGNPKASRAVGNANHNNHILIIVPCHRVIASNGDLSGFGAGGVVVKKFLIDLEKNMGVL